MQLGVRVYLKPLKQKQSILSIDEHRGLFQNLDEVGKTISFVYEITVGPTGRLLLSKLIHTQQVSIKDDTFCLYFI